MKVVIKLSDKIYDTILDDEMPTNEQMKVIVQRIYEGTPLPKGHGRLIDADDIPNQIELKGFLQQDDAHLVTIQRVKEALNEAPTVIEPERMEEMKND